MKVKQKATKEELTLENAKQLSALSLCLPACRISESVQQLMDLAINTLCEAIGSSPYWYVPVLRTLNYIVSDLVTSDYSQSFRLMCVMDGCKTNVSFSTVHCIFLSL